MTALDLSAFDLATILESLAYSKYRIREAQGTPYEIRTKKLQLIEGVEKRLREAKRLVDDPSKKIRNLA